jgi:two-component system cell cycle sensor histidine kinase/response regulator CckA
MLVEDEPRLAILGQRVLESAGFEVVVHTSSMQALEEFRADPQGYDLLVTDNTMPHMTGLQLVENVLASRPDIPILMVSGIGESMSVEALKEVRCHQATLQTLPGGWISRQRPRNSSPASR